MMRHLINTVPRQVVPVGYVVAYSGEFVPEGWLPCEGQIVSQTKYPELFAVIGTAYDRRYKVPSHKKWWQFTTPRMLSVVESTPGLFRLPDLREGMGDEA